MGHPPPSRCPSPRVLVLVLVLSVGCSCDRGHGDPWREEEVAAPPPAPSAPRRPFHLHFWAPESQPAPSKFFPKQHRDRHQRQHRQQQLGAGESSDDFYKEICWSALFFPELCCSPPRGFLACFSGDVTYELCCGEHRLVAASPADQDPHEEDGWTERPFSSAEVPDVVKVDLVVRSFHKDKPFLEVLLESISLFWPFGQLRTRVILVLDAESPETGEVCQDLEARFPSWLRCLGEPLPAFLQGGPSNVMRQPIFHRVHWSGFWADRYASEGADFVGVLDADVIFHSFGIEHLLFASYHRPGQRSRLVKPIITGEWSATAAFSALAVQDEFLGINFMDSLPLVVRKSDFKACRDHIRDRMRALTSVADLSFDEAFVLADMYVDTSASEMGWFQAYSGESLGFHSAMGTFLWKHRQSAYHFSVKGGRGRFATDAPIFASPSSERASAAGGGEAEGEGEEAAEEAASHSSSSSSSSSSFAAAAAAQTSTTTTSFASSPHVAHLSCPSLRPAFHGTDLKRAALRGEVDYRQEGLAIMAAGLCYMLERYSSLDPVSAVTCRTLPWQARDLLLLSWDVQVFPWRPAEWRHCGPRALPRLLLAFDAYLLGTSPASPGLRDRARASLRRLLRSNATGNYEKSARSGSERMLVQVGR